ncbi:hypothetical protein STEG23_035218, partial [Scotinomys teguina]
MFSWQYTQGCAEGITNTIAFMLTMTSQKEAKMGKLRYSKTKVTPVTELLIRHRARDTCPLSELDDLTLLSGAWEKLSKQGHSGCGSQQPVHPSFCQDSTGLLLPQ